MRLKFIKMVGAGNDFVLVDTIKDRTLFGLKDWSNLAKIMCKRKTGIGADGLLIIGRSKKADFRMQIFNPDGSEAEMCGNGLRCAAYYKGMDKTTIETRAGIYEAEIRGANSVRIRMERPKDIRLDMPISVNGRRIKVNFIDTGVPHTVVFVNGIEDIDVENIGRTIRKNGRFRPNGTNVDFVEVLDNRAIKMRTYERGVEGETLACGTGAVAAGIITAMLDRGCRRHPRKVSDYLIYVYVKGGLLKVGFNLSRDKIKDVYLEGEAKKVFEGEVVIPHWR